MTRLRELVGLAAVLAIAAILRLPDLATRAPWDADQGHDMLVLRAFVRDGVVPLLGPPTSIGEVHHGAAYYGLLAPAAWLTGGDSPFAVTLWIALLGIAAVGITVWLTRSMGGPVAGLAAGLAMAVSAASVEESTFIWNPNVVALTSGLAIGGALAAWSSGRPRWWLVAGLGAALTTQAHVLGIVLTPALAGLFVADVRRAADAGTRRRLAAVGLGALALAAATYLPLLAHEMSTGGAEIRALLAYIGSGAGGGDGTAADLPFRIAVVAARIVGWPLAGLITDAPAAVLAAVIAVTGVIAWRWSSPVRIERQAVRWMAVTIAWSAVGLAILAPSLATVIEGLPNDHYHAFADPLVFALVGLGAAAALRATGPTSHGGWPRTRVGTGAATIALVGLAAWNLATQPPSAAPGGSFADADAAGRRILETAAGRPLALRSLPAFKTDESLRYPLVRSGVTPVDETRAAVLVVICDPRFEPVLGRACGGPAEDASVSDAPSWGEPRLVARFTASARAVVSIYERP